MLAVCRSPASLGVPKILLTALSANPEAQQAVGKHTRPRGCGWHVARPRRLLALLSVEQRSLLVEGGPLARVHIVAAAPRVLLLGMLGLLLRQLLLQLARHMTLQRPKTLHNDLL